MTFRPLLAAAGLLAALAAAPTPAHAIIDVIEAPNGFFVPDDSFKLSQPTYYRDYSQDWSWQHNAIPGAATATLSISSFDIDTPDEVDKIYGWDVATTAWVYIGDLSGTGSAWSYTTFNVPGGLIDDVQAGLQVMIDIDVNNTQPTWLVSLAKSVICTDGNCDLPTPDPSVPEPATMGILGMALAGLVAARRRRRG